MSACHESQPNQNTNEPQLSLTFTTFYQLCRNIVPASAKETNICLVMGPFCRKQVQTLYGYPMKSNLNFTVFFRPYKQNQIQNDAIQWIYPEQKYLKLIMVSFTSW